MTLTVSVGAHRTRGEPPRAAARVDWTGVTAQVLERDPCLLRFHNSSIILNAGGGPTDDKPTVTMAAPSDPDTVSCALNVRVADAQAVYRLWRSRGARFLTPPLDRGSEIRCYLRDPDGHLIEVGQTTVARQS